MSLKDIKIPKGEVEVSPGSTFAVQGLCTADLEYLIRKHGAELRPLFMDAINGKLGDLMSGDMMPILQDIATRIPDAVASVVYLATDSRSDEELQVAKQLPVAVQVAALSQIAVLTLSTNGDMGKAGEAVTKLLGSVNAGMVQAAQEMGT